MRYLTILRIPMAAIALNFFLLTEFGLDLVPGTLGDAVFNIFRTAALIYAGWIVFDRYKAAMPIAILTGAPVLFFDHVVLKGGGFWVQGLMEGDSLEEVALAFGGVLLSFVIFVPLAIALTGIGGAIGLFRRARRRRTI